jgi:23S rRNA (guanosine2251-2'-O)-methyltransferase
VKTEILYGIHPVQEALKAGRRKFYEIYLARDNPAGRLDNILKITKDLDIAVIQLKSKQLSVLAKTSEHQGIGAKVSVYPIEGLNQILDRQISGECSLILILDQVVDPRNLGALIRTALAVGVQGVIIPKDRSAPPTPVASKASAGAMEHLHLIKVPNLVGAIKQIKTTGIWVAGLDRSAPKSVFESDLTDPLAIVIGAEEKGLRPLVKAACDFLVSIPQIGPVDSLNASVAGAVAMYEAFRQRNQKRKK